MKEQMNKFLTSRQLLAILLRAPRLGKLNSLLIILIRIIKELFIQQILALDFEIFGRKSNVMKAEVLNCFFQK